MWQRLASVDALVVAAAAFVAVALVSLNGIVGIRRVVGWIWTVIVVII
jgi:hypothetical protein